MNVNTLRKKMLKVQPQAIMSNVPLSPWASMWSWHGTQYAAQGIMLSRLREIPRISVHVSDVNGPRGGVDKLCQITADVRGSQPVMILEKGVDLLAVINRAVRRLRYRIGRRVHRERIAGAPEHRATIRAA